MADGLAGRMLHWLRVPREPQPPPGDPTRLRVFRASKRYLGYRQVLWGLKQASAVGALLFWFFVIGSGRIPGLPGFIGIIEMLAWVGFLLQLPFSYAILRIDFEMRWYMLTDRSLRIRDGVLNVREQTMMFANVQNISIRQNPLQRLFGIADVAVRTAGGGGSSQQQGEKKSGMHEASFQGVDNPEEIRDAIRARIRQHGGAGLGDPDEVAVKSTAAVATSTRAAAHGGGMSALGVPQATTAARALLEEARLLRQSLAADPTLMAGGP
ncbi:hypothetical protein BH23GEM9_BH23GEM9_28700 [soil metagenome]